MPKKTRASRSKQLATAREARQLKQRSEEDSAESIYFVPTSGPAMLQVPTEAQSSEEGPSTSGLQAGPSTSTTSTTQTSSESGFDFYPPDGPSTSGLQAGPSTASTQTTSEVSFHFDPLEGPSTSGLQAGPSSTSTPARGGLFRFGLYNDSSSDEDNTSTSTSGIPLTTRIVGPDTSEDRISLVERSIEKKKLFEKYVQYEQEVSGPENQNILIQFGPINNLISSLKCPVCCNVGYLSVNSPSRFGFSVKLVIVCDVCKENEASEFSSERNTKSASQPQPFVLNETSVLAALLSGMGPITFRAFCEHMDLPGLHQKTFNRIAQRIFQSNERVGKDIFARAATIVRQEHIRFFGGNGADRPDDVLDIAVSFDGSWLTRGHKSLIGIGCVVDVLTGLVIDGHVSSAYCHLCAKTGEWIKRENPHRYDAWREQHIASGKCTVNFMGTSGMMEVRAAEILWQRSIEQHNLRYTMLVSDGDSKAYNRLKELMPYGHDVDIVKEECLNHVGKCMGTALRNLLGDSKKRGITLGGVGYGRLSQETVKKLTKYYTRAIRGLKTAEEMRTAIFASIYHGYSTDAWPQHQHCPPGQDSWCFYKRSIALKQNPYLHGTKAHGTPLNYNLLHEHLEPIYDRLTSDALLKRCEMKATQNPNESFHNSMWSRCHKETFHSLKRVQFGLISAAAEFNEGPDGISFLKESLGFGLGSHTVRLAKARERQRLYYSAFEASQESKKRRKHRAEAREKARKEALEREGSSSYASGMF